MPLVSVIVPAYNTGPYIREALASVLAQTISDLEILVVDDGSDDQTAAIAEMAAAGDGRIKLFRKANGGVSSARNLALRMATGEYLALLDSDDIWDPSFLEEQVAILQARPEIDLVTGNALDLGGHRDGLPVRPCPDPRPAPDLAAILADETSVFIMTVFRRAVYERLGGFDETLRTNEDYDYWLRATVAGFVFAQNDRPLGHYRRSGTSLSGSEVRMLSGILRVYRKLRPSLLDRPSELALLDRQVERFEIEVLVAETRNAIESGDGPTAAARLNALRQRRPGAALGVAALLARWAPGLLTLCYRSRLGQHLKRRVPAHRRVSGGPLIHGRAEPMG